MAGFAVRLERAGGRYTMMGCDAYHVDRSKGQTVVRMEERGKIAEAVLEDGDKVFVMNSDGHTVDRIARS